MSNKYTYSITNDFPNQKVGPARLTEEIENSSITIVLDYINTSSDDCNIWFKANLPGGDIATLSGIVASHNGEFLDEIEPPTMADGRPIVRAESRPINYQTMFTMSGDDTDMGNGQEMYWDFSNDDDLVTTSGLVPDGYKMKDIVINFCDNIYVKEGTIYFHDALKKSYLEFCIICPSGNYYYDRNGNPQLATEEVMVMKYLSKHFFAGDCPMGDELNTESCNENPIPPNYEFHIHVYVPEADNSSFGYGELELYRVRSCLLPGEEM